MKFACICIVLSSFVASYALPSFAAEGEQPLMTTETAPQNQAPPTTTGTPSNLIPKNQKPPAATAASAMGAQTQTGLIYLPNSPTRAGKDICGNPIGTGYGEGYKCPDLEDQSGPYITRKSPWEKSLTIIAAGMAGLFAVLYLSFHYFAGNKIEEWGARNFIIILVVGSAVFILTAGYDDKQAAPLFGLFGTLVGYLFGRAPQEQPAGNRPGDQTAGQPGGAGGPQSSAPPGSRTNDQVGGVYDGPAGGQIGGGNEVPGGTTSAQSSWQQAGQTSWQPTGRSD